MGSHIPRVRWRLTLIAVVGVVGLCASGAVAGEQRSAAPVVTANAPAWPVDTIVRHIDAMDQIDSTQARTQEFLRILGAIMRVPDAATRTTLFNRVRGHLAPLEPSHAQPSDTRRTPASRATAHRMTAVRR